MTDTDKTGTDPVVTDAAMADLDLLFSAARQDSPQLPAALADRMIADANAVQAGWAAPRRAPSSAAPGMLSQLVALLGGWAGVSGLATACAVGIWFGFAPPSDLLDPVQLVLQSQSNLELFDGYDLVAALATEEG